MPPLSRVHGRLAGSRVGARWRWVSLVLCDPPMPSRKPGYRGPVSLMGEALGSAPWILCPLLGLRDGWEAGSPNMFYSSWIFLLLKHQPIDNMQAAIDRLMDGRFIPVIVIVITRSRKHGVRHRTVTNISHYRLHTAPACHPSLPCCLAKL